MGWAACNLTWTASQRGVIAGLLVVLMGMIAWRAWRDGQYIPDPPPEWSPHAARVAAGVDPNTADLATLATLPGIGEARAQAILEYRAWHATLRLDEPPFACPEDLLKVRGFGVALVEQMREHLIFPEAPRSDGHVLPLADDKRPRINNPSNRVPPSTLTP